MAEPVLRVRSHLEAAQIAEPVCTHTLELWGRASRFLGDDSRLDDPRAWAVALEYLAIRMNDTTTVVEDVASRRDVTTTSVLKVLPELRKSVAFRSYVGEWIRRGRPEPEKVETPTVPRGLLTEAEVMARDGKDASTD